LSNQSPLHGLTAAAGARFAEVAGWQVPAFFVDPAGEYRQAREQAAVFDLSHRGKVEATGPEAARFLHNLSTNDIAGLAVNHGCEAFFTTAKAKVIAHAWIWHLQQDRFWLDADPVSEPRLFKHLDRHLISERVELSDRTSDFAQLFVTGANAATVLASVFNAPLPDGDGRSTHAMAPIQVRRSDRLGIPGFDVLIPVDDAAGVWRVIVGRGASPAGLEAYDLLRIEAGLPVMNRDIDEERFVVEVDRGLRAICYTKGCYLGQEPIVMARDRGHVNRMLLGLKLAGPGAVPAKARVLREGTEIGEVTSSVVSPQLGPIALAYLRRGNWEPGTLVSVEDRAAEVVSLPFAG